MALNQWLTKYCDTAKNALVLVTPMNNPRKTNFIWVGLINQDYYTKQGSVFNLISLVLLKSAPLLGYCVELRK